MWVYSITVDFSPTLYYWPYVTYHRENRLKAVKRLCLCSLRSHPNLSTFFLPVWGMLREGLNAFRLHFKIWWRGLRVVKRLSLNNYTATTIIFLSTDVSTCSIYYLKRLVTPEKAASVTGITLRTTGPCAGGLSAVVASAISTQLCDPNNEELSRWCLTV